jgi:transcriptional regulator
MYTPEQFTENDSQKIVDLVKKNPFGMLITEHNGSLCINHYPFLFECETGSRGVLIGHMAKNNPQWKSFSEDKPVTAVFNGAHGYISPTLYATPGVPTWNYATVHLQGKPTLIEDTAGVENILEKMTAHFESNQSTPWKLNFPVAKDKLLSMIVGFEIEIQKSEGKFKLSQNKTPQEQQHIISELAQSNHTGDIELSTLMASYFS